MSELPKGWVSSSIEELGDVRLGRQRSPSRATGPNMCPYMRAANVSWIGIRLEDVKLMDFTPAEQEVYRLRKGDILVGEASGSRSEVGKSAVWKDEIPNACFQNTLIRVRPLLEISSEYVQHHLQADARSGRLAEVSKGVGIHHLSAKGLKEWEISLPPLNEQKRIVAKIDALTEKSREARQALDEVPALLDQLRQSILAAAFRGDLTKKWREQNPNVEPASVLLDRIRQERRRKWEEAELAKFKAKGKVPTDDKWKAKYREPEPVDTEGLPELPEGWCWSSINELTLMSGGITKGQQRKAEVRTRPVPYLRVANVQRGSLSLEELAEIEATDEQIEQLRLQPGDLLLNEGGDIDKLGRGWVWRGELETCIHQNHVFRARPVSRDLDPEFISHFTNTFGQRYFLDSGKQTTNLASVSMTRVKACPVPVAPVAETKAVVTAIRDTLKSAQSVISIHSASTEHLETLDASILAKAFRGELVPQDPNDEPAFVLLERIRKERGGEAPNKNGRKNKGKGRSPAL